MTSNIYKRVVGGVVTIHMMHLSKLATQILCK